MPVDAVLWSDGRALVMSKQAELPDVCIKCGAPAEGYRLKRNLRWHPPAYYLVILINLILYAIVALIVAKKATIYVGVCQQHRSRTKRFWATRPSAGSRCRCRGSASMIVGGSDDSLAFLVFVGIIVFFVGVLYGLFTARLVAPKKIDDYFVWLDKVAPSILVDLPPWPGPR